MPELLFKRDVFPGNVRNTFEVTLDKEGRYVGRCAELCGTYHAFMQFEMVVGLPGEVPPVPGPPSRRRVHARTRWVRSVTPARAFASTTDPFDSRRHGSRWNSPAPLRPGSRALTSQTAYKIFAGVAVFLFGAARSTRCTPPATPARWSGSASSP